jgi:hypothetical protein
VQGTCQVQGISGDQPWSLCPVQDPSLVVDVPAANAAVGSPNPGQAIDPRHATDVTNA